MTPENVLIGKIIIDEGIRCILLNEQSGYVNVL